MMRYVALLVKSDNLIVFFSRKGGAPERILTLTVGVWSRNKGAVALRSLHI